MNNENAAAELRMQISAENDKVFPSFKLLVKENAQSRGPVQLELGGHWVQLQVSTVT